MAKRTIELKTFLAPEEYVPAKAVADEEDRSMSGLIRIAVNEYVARRLQAMAAEEQQRAAA